MTDAKPECCSSKLTEILPYKYKDREQAKFYSDAKNERGTYTAVARLQGPNYI
jgi:hypothetical protein